MTFLFEVRLRDNISLVFIFTYVFIIHNNIIILCIRYFVSKIKYSCISKMMCDSNTSNIFFFPSGRNRMLVGWISRTVLLFTSKRKPQSSTHKAANPTHLARWKICPLYPPKRRFWPLPPYWNRGHQPPVVGCQVSLTCLASSIM